MDKRRVRFIASHLRFPLAVMLLASAAALVLVGPEVLLGLPDLLRPDVEHLRVGHRGNQLREDQTMCYFERLRGGAMNEVPLYIQNNLALNYQKIITCRLK